MNIHDFFGYENAVPVYELTKNITVDEFVWHPGSSPLKTGRAELKSGTKLVKNSYSNYGLAHSMSTLKSRTKFYVVKYADMRFIEYRAR